MSNTKHTPEQAPIGVPRRAKRIALSHPDTGEEHIITVRQAIAAQELLDEMNRHLWILERLEREPELWERFTVGTGVATLNGYRNAIAKATQP